MLPSLKKIEGLYRGSFVSMTKSILGEKDSIGVNSIKRSISSSLLIFTFKGK